MNKEQHPLEIQTLLLKAQLDRMQLKQATRRFQENLQPEVIKDALVRVGSQKVAGLLPSVPAVFDLLQKYPGLSFGIARGLMRVAQTKSGLVKTLALGAASWFIYNRFQKKDDIT